MNHCFLVINLDGFSENASADFRFFQKKLSPPFMRGGTEKRDFLSDSTGKMRFLSYL